MAQSSRRVKKELASFLRTRPELTQYHFTVFCGLKQFTRPSVFKEGARKSLRPPTSPPFPTCSAPICNQVLSGLVLSSRNTLKLPHRERDLWQILTEMRLTTPGKRGMRIRNSGPEAVPCLSEITLVPLVSRPWDRGSSRKLVTQKR